MMASTHIALALLAAKFVYPPAQATDWASGRVFLAGAFAVKIST